MIGTCECCQAKDVLVVRTEHMSALSGRVRPIFEVCELCRNSFAFNAMCYSGQYLEHTLYATINRGFNEILKAIKHSTSGRPEEES